MTHDNDYVRNKLIEITNQGLMLKAIALNVGIDANDLSRFKGGMECLKQSDVEVLSEYLNEVHIPHWKTAIKEKSKYQREGVYWQVKTSRMKKSQREGVAM